jgi:hypothetical protein
MKAFELALHYMFGKPVQPLVTLARCSKLPHKYMAFLHLKKIRERSTLDRDQGLDRGEALL